MYIEILVNGEKLYGYVYPQRYYNAIDNIFGYLEDSNSEPASKLINDAVLEFGNTAELNEATLLLNLIEKS
jgi:hypothetical protein